MGSVSGVSLTKALNYELPLIEVTLVSGLALRRRWKRFGFPHKFSDFDSRYPGFSKDLIDDQATYATLFRTGKLKDIRSEVNHLVKKELYILSASQLGWGRRKNNACIELVDPQSARQKYKAFYINTDEYGWHQPNKLVGRWQPLVLDERWKEFNHSSFLLDFLRMMRDGSSISSKWRNSLSNALRLAGQSQSTFDMPKAFLWNMIALESLLTSAQDKVSKELPERVKAFIGWVDDWKSGILSRKIDELYQKRCRMVHDGQIDGVEYEDVFILDEILVNVLMNILKHLRLFPTKQALIEFSKKIEAEEILGLKPKVQPKSLAYWRKVERHNTDGWVD